MKPAKSTNHFAVETLPSGIEHGPYLSYAQSEPKELQRYIDRYGNADWAQAKTPFKQFLADRESEWQFDQHCAAAERAVKRTPDPISREKFHYWMVTVLRPLWIGSRTPSKVQSPRRRTR